MFELHEDMMLCEQVKALIEGERDCIANLANISALLGQVLEQINWVGFYLMKKGELVLGPFQGKVACIRIPVGKGVCGTAVATKDVQRIADVHQFEGHIACDSASQSEIVIPLVVDGTVVGVLDIDSPIKNRFSETDQKILEEVARLLEVGCEWVF
ncbi:MAG: GAF domain-containing protein [Cellulosilyticaceae bacterium]